MYKSDILLYKTYHLFIQQTLTKDLLWHTSPCSVLWFSSEWMCTPDVLTDCQARHCAPTWAHCVTCWNKGGWARLGECGWMMNSAFEGEVEDGDICQGSVSPIGISERWPHSWWGGRRQAMVSLCASTLGPGILHEYLKMSSVVSFSEGRWIWRGSLWPC